MLASVVSLASPRSTAIRAAQTFVVRANAEVVSWIVGGLLLLPVTHHASHTPVLAVLIGLRLVVFGHRVLPVVVEQTVKVVGTWLWLEGRALHRRRVLSLIFVVHWRHHVPEGDARLVGGFAVVGERLLLVRLVFV